MKYRTLFVAVGVIAVLVIGAVGPTMAHEEQTVEGYDLTFGGSDEPVITGERMWLQLEIVDAETGEPIEGQAETLHLSVQSVGNEKVPLDVSESHGEAGLYEAAVIFTEPGEYMIHVEGSLEGTEIHTHFEKEVRDQTELEYPGDGGQSSDNGSESESDSDHNESRVRENGDDVRDNDPSDQTDQAGFASRFGLKVAAAVIGLITVIGAFR